MQQTEPKNSSYSNPWNKVNVALHIQNCHNVSEEKKKSVHQAMVYQKYLLEKEKLKCPSCKKYTLVPPGSEEKNNIPNSWYNKGKEITTFRNYIMCPCIQCSLSYLRQFDSEYKVFTHLKSRNTGQIKKIEMLKFERMMFAKETETFGRNFDCEKMTIIFLFKNEKPFEIQLDL
jgi:hypothetical protein